MPQDFVRAIDENAFGPSKSGDFTQKIRAGASWTFSGAAMRKSGNGSPHPSW
jgi:hypothetical protein